MKKTVMIIIPVLLMSGLIFYFGFKTNASKYEEFRGGGYIISKIYNNEGDYVKSEKYYFNEGTKYKKNYSDQITFDNANEEKVQINKESFIHYDNGSLSVLKKSAILNLDKLEAEAAILYYSFNEGTLLENKSNVYSVNSANNKVDFTNFIIKINENKYLIVSNNMVLNVSGKERKIENGYFEIEFFEGDIVRIENNEVSLQSVSSEAYFQLANGIKVNLSNRFVSKGDENILNLNEMTIESNDNIELIEEEKEEEIVEEEEEVEPENPLSGIGNGIINSGSGSGDEEVNENTKENDPVFTITELNITSNKMQAEIQITDTSSLLFDDISIKLIEASTNKIIYSTKENEGTMNISVEIETLSPETNYIFVVSSSYKKGGNEYTRDFIQKNILTESVGIEIKKDFFTTNVLSFIAYKKDYSNLKSVEVTLLDSLGRVVKNSRLEFEGLSEVSFNFENLTNNSAYTLRLSNYLYSDAVITDSYVNDKTYKTLKLKPEIGQNSFVIDKKNSLFTLKLSNVEDPDNGIVSYKYKLYDLRDLNEDTPVQVIEKNSKGSVDVSVDNINVQRGVPYAFKVVIVFNDNEKEYEYETELSDVMKMDGVAFPTLKFDATNVTFERIKGNIVIIDDGNTVSLDDSSIMTITYTDSVGVQKTFTSSGSLNIPFDVNYLRKNETYTISVYATVDLQDGNLPINSCYLGSVIVKTEDTNPFYLNYTVDTANTNNAFKIDARLTPYNENNTDLEANTMTGLIFNLYEGTSTSGTLVKTVRKVDRNLAEYVSELKTEYYDNLFYITPELFNLKNQDLKAEYYTIEVVKAYDYTSYENEIRVINNIVTTKTVGYVPSLPNDKDDAIDVKTIRNKDAGARYRDDLDPETIVGYSIRARYDNSNKYGKFITYKLHNGKTNEVIDQVNYSIEDDGSLKYIDFFLEDGTHYNTTDADFRRGNDYYFSYVALLDLNFDGETETIYPSDPDVILKSKVLSPEKQSPTLTMYPSISNESTFTWKYKISDIDNSLIENKFYYSIDGKDKTPISLTKSNNYETATFTGLSNGYFEISLQEALLKKDSEIKKNQAVYQKFDGVYTPSPTRYVIYKEVNRLIISFLDYTSSPLFDRVAGAKVEFTAGSDKITLDNVQIDNGNIVVDFSEIEDFINRQIKTNVTLYYDSGISGFETGAISTALQITDNGVSDNRGQYYYNNTPNSFQTSAKPAGSIFNIALNSDHTKMTVTNKITSNDLELDIRQEKGGISYNYETLMPKQLKEYATINTSDEFFTFDKIIPSISLLNNKGSLDISPTLIGVKFKINLYGAGGGRIKDDQVFIEIFKTNDEGSTSEFVNSTTFTVNDLKGVVTVKGLTPKSNYYAKFYAYVKSGSTYVKEQLYDMDFQTNTKNYYFKTLGDVGITNITTKYEADSYEKRKLKLTYKLAETVGYDRIEYEIYELIKDSRGIVTEELVPLDISNDTIMKSEMTKYIDIPPGCGIEMNKEYRIIIRPYSVIEIDGVQEDIELIPNSNSIFNISQLSEPYVGISSSVVNDSTLEFKVNFYDTNRTIYNEEYQVEFFDAQGTKIETEYDGIYYSSNASKRFTITNLQEGQRYMIKVLYKINIINQIDSLIEKEKVYLSTLIATDGISIGNFSVVTDLNDTSRMRLLFYDSYKLTEITKIRYSIYSSNGFSLDQEENFIPITLTLDNGIVYYYYTLNTVLPETGQYYLQLQFLKNDQVITEQSVEYNYVK